MNDSFSLPEKKVERIMKFYYLFISLQNAVIFYNLPRYLSCSVSLNVASSYEHHANNNSPVITIFNNMTYPDGYMFWLQSDYLI